MSAIKIGSLVWSGYSGLLRMGTITGQRTAENGWVYYTISWHDDSQYEETMSYYNSVNPNRDYGLKEYKASLVHPINPVQLSRFARLHYEFVEDDSVEEYRYPSEMDDGDDVVDFLV
jgi:hypothetical protein